MSDDVIVWGRSQQEYNTALESMLQRFQEKGLTLNGPKCRYNKTSFEFYGVIFSKGGVKPDPKLVSAFVNALPNQNASDVRSLLGMAQYCSKFVEDCATMNHCENSLKRM